MREGNCTLHAETEHAGPWNDIMDPEHQEPVGNKTPSYVTKKEEYLPFN